MGPYSKPIFYDYKTLSQSKWLEDQPFPAAHTQYMGVPPPLSGLSPSGGVIVTRKASWVKC